MKEYMILRVDELEAHRELAGESALELEARRFAGMLAETEPAPCAIAYEVRLSHTGELVGRIPVDDRRNEHPGRRELKLAV